MINDGIRKLYAKTELYITYNSLDIKVLIRLGIFVTRPAGNSAHARP